MRSVESADCGKYGVWKVRSVENFNLTISISIFHFNFLRNAEKQCVNNKKKNVMNHCILRCAGLGW